MIEVDLIFFQKINQFAGKWPLLDNLAIFFAEYLGYILILILLFFLTTRVIAKAMRTAFSSLPSPRKRGSVGEDTAAASLTTRVIAKGGDTAAASLTKDSKKYWPIIAQAILAAVLARFGITELIRFFWERPRPFIENNVNLLLSHSATGSFPSGHAAFFFALSAVVYFYNKKTGFFFFLASFLISISRVFCGVHWPSDIIAGAAIGIFSGWIIRLFSQKFFLTVKK